MRRNVCTMLRSIAVVLAPRALLLPLLILRMMTIARSSRSLRLFVGSIAGSVVNSRAAIHRLKSVALLARLRLARAARS